MRDRRGPAADCRCSAILAKLQPDRLHNVLEQWAERLGALYTFLS